LTRSPTRTGWLASLRRFSGLGALVFAVVLVVGAARVHALALAAGDDELCVAMGGSGLRAAKPLPVDPSDLASGHHACCDLGLCIDASSLPPVAPSAASPRRIVRRVPRTSVPSLPCRRRRRGGPRPRAPPIG